MYMSISTAHACAKCASRSWALVFPYKFSHEIGFVRCPCSFRRRRLAQSESPDPGFQFFAWEFSYKIALVRCTCPFQLRKLAQSVRLSFGPRFFPCKLSRKITLVRCPCSFRLRRLAKSESPDPGFRFFCSRICIQNCSCEMYMSISTAQTCTKCAPKFWAPVFPL